MATIDVILPVFERRLMLRRAVLSVVNQTWKNWNLYIIDDGSKPSVKPYINDIIENDSRIQYHYLTHNHGVSYARNTGVRLGDAPWICFLDSDDLWHRKKLQLQVQFSINNPDCKIHQTTEVWIRNYIRVNAPKHLQKQSGDLFEQSLERCMITPSSVMLERKLLNEYGGFDENLAACEDYDLWIAICAHQKIGLINEDLLTRFAGHEHQLSAKFKCMDLFRLQSLVKHLKTLKLARKQHSLLLCKTKEKYNILLQGAQKRSNTSLLNQLQFFEIEIKNHSLF